MSRILVSVLAEVAANCYFSMHTQFSTSLDVEGVSCAQVQDKHNSLPVANRIRTISSILPNKAMLTCHMSYTTVTTLNVF